MSSEFENIASQFESSTNSVVENELAAVELEMKQLDLEIKREQVAKIKQARQTALDNARSRTLAIKQYLATRDAIQRNCNHRKGGQGHIAVIAGRGDSPSYAIVKHTLPNRGIFVLCTRCLKEWYPADPLHVEGGKIVPKAETPGYSQAVAWNTDNTPSGSSIFFITKTEPEPAGVKA